MILRQLSYTFLLVSLITTTACSGGGEDAPPAAPAPAAESSRKFLLEQVDDAAVIQLYADQFTALPLREKTLIWHLSQAAVAGRDIFFDQKHRNALEMRRVLEAIVSHPTGVEPATLAEIQRYTKLFWINTGPYNNLTARKFVLKLTPQALAAAVKASAAAGATFPTPANESVEHCSRVSARCSSIRTSTRASRTRHRDQERTSSAPAPITCTPV
jgi:hypothetical protein